MNANPEDLRKALEKPSAAEKRHARDLERIRQEGYLEGRRKGHGDAIDFLQAKYIEDRNRPDRNTPMARTMLKLAKELAEHLRGIDTGKPKRGKR